MWQELIKTLGIGALALAAMAWLARRVISLYLSKDIERYKAQLKRDSDKELEELRASLHRAAYEHEVRFSRLHDRRALVISELYSDLVDAFDRVDILLAPLEFGGEPTKQEKYNEAAKALRTFIAFFERNRIYLDEELCGTIGVFIREAGGPALEFASSLAALEEGQVSHKEHVQKWMSAIKSFREKVPRIRRSLEDEFRSLLGVTPVNRQPNKADKSSEPHPEGGSH